LNIKDISAQTIPKDFERHAKIHRCFVVRFKELHSGWTRHSINPGDRVGIEFHPLRDGSHGGGVNSVTLMDTGQKLQANFGAQEKPGLQ
jgi:hypothetical protein